MKSIGGDHPFSLLGKETIFLLIFNQGTLRCERRVKELGRKVLCRVGDCYLSVNEVLHGLKLHKQDIPRLTRVDDEPEEKNARL